MKRLFLVPLILLAACAKEQVPAPEPVPVPDYPSASELAAMLEAGETTSVLVVEALLARAEAAEDLKAFITIDAEGALRRAAELDAMRADGSVLGPLHGVPLVVKDNIHVAGLPNTAGTPGLKGFTPDKDNAVVAALKDAGAIILGKTNLHELAFGITSDNAAFGSVGNPWDKSLFAGGSSGGTASAISAGLAPAGLGTDTGGSVRIPAAHTDIVGFRPSTGRYDTTAVTPISHTRDTVGLMAPTVDDIVVMDGVIDPAGEPVGPIGASDIRLGVAREYYFANLDAQSTKVVDSVLAKLEEAGVTLVEVDPGDVAGLNEKSAFPIALYEVVRELPEYLETHGTGQGFDGIASSAASPDVQGLFGLLGTAEGQVPDDVYADALTAREQMRAMFKAYFESNDLDAMIFPTTLLPARPIEGSMQTVELNGEQVPTFPTYIHNTDPASIAALPGISLPAGLTAQGLPVGIELDGPEGSDRQLLAIALVLEPIIEFSAHP